MKDSQVATKLIDILQKDESISNPKAYTYTSSAKSSVTK